jgi:hypothetical protein
MDFFSWFFYLYLNWFGIGPIVVEFAEIFAIEN